jgi:hypothetical protein
VKAFITIHGVYVGFWMLMGSAWLVGLYFVIRFAIVAAARDLAR